MSKQDNSRDSIPYNIESLQQHITDAKLRLALLEYQQKQDQVWKLKRDALPIDAPAKVAENDFFARTEKTTLKLIRRHEPRAVQSSRARRKSRLLQAFAAAVLILVLGFGTALAVSPELRVGVMRLLYTITPQFTEIRFLPELIAERVPEAWKGSYYPMFMPSNYAVSEVSESEYFSKVLCHASHDRYLLFGEYEAGSELNIDSEGKTVEEVDINGWPGLMTWKDGSTIIVWNSPDSVLVIDTTEDKATTLAIARSVAKAK